MWPSAVETEGDESGPPGEVFLGLFHVKHFARHRRRSDLMFHVKQSLPNAKACKNLAQHLLCADPPRDPLKCPRGQPDIFGRQLRTDQ